MSEQQATSKMSITMSTVCTSAKNVKGYTEVDALQVLPSYRTSADLSSLTH